MQKKQGRPPKAYSTSVRMKRSTRHMLRYLCRNTGQNQATVLDIAIKRLYEDEDND